MKRNATAGRFRRNATSTCLRLCALKMKSPFNFLNEGAFYGSSLLYHGQCTFGVQLFGEVLFNGGIVQRSPVLNQAPGLAIHSDGADGYGSKADKRDIEAFELFPKIRSVL